MARKRFSMRTQVAGLVIFTGVLGLALALLAGEYYQYLTRDALARITALKAQELLGEDETRAADLALELQRGTRFRRAWERRSVPALEALLEQRLGDPRFTAGTPALIGLQLLDARRRPVARAGHGTGRGALCPALMARLRATPAGQRPKPVAALCAAATHLHHVTVTAIVGRGSGGYLAVITDPAPAWQRLERSIGIPLQVSVGLRPIYRSPEWPDTSAAPLGARATLEAYGGAQPTVELAADAGELGASLRGARFSVLMVGSTATLGVVWLGLWLFNRCTLGPLARLTEQMRQVRGDRSQLGTQVTPCGNAEVRELTEDFNEFSAELKELHSTMESLAYHDTLTGLPNRLLFRDRLGQQVRNFERDGERFAVCLIDLDRFKEINDTHGHHAGDLLLQQLAQRLRRALRKSDTLALTGNTLARLGGDEFCALLPAVRSMEDAATVAAKLLAALQEPFEVEGERLRVGMSIGFALFPGHAETPEVLCRCADAAMYQAKRNGTGFAVYDAHTVVSAVAS